MAVVLSEELVPQEAIDDLNFPPRLVEETKSSLQLPVVFRSRGKVERVRGLETLNLVCLR